MYAPHRPAVRLPNGLVQSLSAFRDTVPCLLCKMACINPVPFGISEWLDRYSDYPRAQLDNGYFTDGMHCPSDAFYCSTCHIVFTRRVFTEHRLLTMLANRDEFEWQERIDGPNFGSLATRICHVPFYVHLKYNHFPVQHGRYHPITYGTDRMLPQNQMYAAHRDQGPLSLGVIYDCSLEVGNPQNLGGGSCVTPQEMYDRRRMRVMFPYPEIHASRTAESSPPSETSSTTEAHRAGQDMDDSDGSDGDLLYEGTEDENTQHSFNWLGNPNSRTDDETMSDDAN